MTSAERPERQIHRVGRDQWPITLPGKFTELRPHQLEAISEILDRYNDGYRVVMLDAPTGAGKTVIGEAVRQLRGRAAGRGIYLCTTLTLQDQFMADFPDARLIKGRSNYPTYDDPMRFVEKGIRHIDASYCDRKPTTHDRIPECEECYDRPPDKFYGSQTPSETKLKHCSFCHPWQSCPYEKAKNNALVGPLTVANTSYFMHEANYVGLLGQRSSGLPNFPIAVIDEADTLEQVLMGFVQLHITSRMLNRTGLDYPKLVTKHESWIEWCEYAIPHLEKQVKAASFRLKQKPGDRRLRAEWEQMTRYTRRVVDIKTKIESDPENWLFDGKKTGELKYKPVRVGPYGHQNLWRHSSEALLMSATLISSDQLAEDVGVPKGDYATVKVDSQFPIERRPIHVWPKASMTHRTKETEWPKMVQAIVEVVNMHPNDRVLVHTVSYDLTKYLRNELVPRLGRRPIKYYLSSKEREDILDEFRSTDAAILLAPSFDRGVDLPDEDVRVIVIAKVPFPHLGDKQVAARFHGTGLSGKSWYATQTIRSLVQMTGRGMRHKDDWCVTYVLDSQFNSNVWRNNRHLIPKWWSDAIKWGSLS